MGVVANVHHDTCAKYTCEPSDEWVWRHTIYTKPKTDNLEFVFVLTRLKDQVWMGELFFGPRAPFLVRYKTVPWTFLEMFQVPAGTEGSYVSQDSGCCKAGVLLVMPRITNNPEDAT